MYRLIKKDTWRNITKEIAAWGSKPTIKQVQEVFLGGLRPIQVNTLASGSVMQYAQFEYRITSDENKGDENKSLFLEAWDPR